MPKQDIKQAILDKIDFQTFYSQNLQGFEETSKIEKTALCPFHDDNDPSFSVNTSTGKFYCHTCGFGGDVFSFYQKKHGVEFYECLEQLASELGINMKIGKDKKNGKKKKSKLGKIIKTYDYKDVEGNLLFQTCRFEPKDFRQRRPDPKNTGMWIWNLKDIDVIPYNLESVLKSDHVCIVEGEKDVENLRKIGIISSCNPMGAGKWKDELSKYFENKNVYILQDNDEPGKKHALDVAKKLNGISKTIKIIELKNLQQKGDVSDWIESGGTKDALISIIKETPEFKVDENSVESDNDTGHEKKQTKGSKIVKKDGAYWHYKATTQIVENFKVSNFTVKILKNYLMEDEIIRVIQLIHENGTVSRESEINSKHMTTKQAFAAWCYAKGNFIWTGTASDLESVWDMEFDESDPRIIIRPDHIGWIGREKLWLFGDSVIKTGKVYTPNKEGTIWIDDEKGFQPMSLNIMDEHHKDNTSGYLPIIRYDLSKEICNINREKIIKNLKANLGGFEAYLLLGWVAACAYYDEIFNAVKFPILFLSGKRYCGKNTMGEVIMSHFGLSEDVSANISEISSAALTRLFSYYSSVPAWVDEYRASDDSCTRHDSALRSAYDRIGSPRGKIGFGVVTYDIKAPVLITGESFPTDSALGSRCLNVQLKTLNREDKYIHEIRKLKPQMSGIFNNFLIDKNKDKTEKLIEDIEKTKAHLEGKGLDPRIAGLYAVVGEAYDNIYNPENFLSDKEEFSEWIKISSIESKEDIEETFALNDFFDSMDAMNDERELNGHHVKYLEKTNEVALCMKSIFPQWQKFCRTRGKNPWNKQSIKKYIMDEAYFVEKERPVRMGKTKRCMILDVTKMPESLSDMFIQWNYSE